MPGFDQAIIEKVSEFTADEMLADRIRTWLADDPVGREYRGYSEAELSQIAKFFEWHRQNG